MDRASDSGSEGWGFESLPVYHSKNAASEKMQRFFFDFLAFYALHTGKTSVFVNFSPVADTDHQDDHPYIKGGKASLAKGRRIPLWKDFDPNPVLDSLCEDAKARADKLPKRELPQPGIPGEEHSPPGIF